MVSSHLYNLPIDLIGLIFSFDNTYVDEFNKSMSLIRLKGCLFRMKYLIKNNKKNYVNSIKKNINDPEYIVHTLSKCTCCFRHIYKKPFHLYDRTWCDVISFPIENISKRDIDCKCKCRMYGRLLCRSFNSYFHG